MSDKSSMANPDVPNSHFSSKCIEEELRGILQNVREAARHTLAEFDCESEQVKQQTSTLSSAVEEAKDLLRNIRFSTRKRMETQQEEFARRFEEQLKKYADSLESNEDRLTELIGKATIGPISKKYADKAALERSRGRVCLVFFYLSLLFAIVGGAGLIIVSLWQCQQDAFPFLVTLKQVLLRFVVLVPVYVPLFWLIVHLNRLAAQKNRLIEEYEHKRMVVETYAGLADQIEALVAKGVESAPLLLCRQLEKTVDAVCFDACMLLDKVNVSSPIGDVANGVSQVMASASGLIKGGKSEHKD